MIIANIQENMFPFKHYTFEKIFSKKELVQIYKLFETYTGCLSELINTSGQRCKSNDRLYVIKDHYSIPIFKQLIDMLQTFFSSLYPKEELYMRIELIRDNAGFWLEPHVDIPEKKLSMMIYVNQEELKDIPGTILYDKDLNEIIEVPYKNNTGFYFIPADDTWHGVQKLTKGPRMAIMANVCTFETDFKL
jgi:hypothetical protein